MNSDQIKEANFQVKMGLDAKALLETEFGRYVRLRADQLRQVALEKLAAASATDEKANTDLRVDAASSHKMLATLDVIISEGDAAFYRLEQLTIED